jgi:hypothetical protein
MIYFFRRAGDMRSCETRLESEGPGFELVVTDGTGAYTEHFDDLVALVARQQELLRAWQMHGWRTIDPFDDISEDDR